MKRGTILMTLCWTPLINLLGQVASPSLDFTMINKNPAVVAMRAEGISAGAHLISVEDKSTIFGSYPQISSKYSQYEVTVAGGINPFRVEAFYQPTSTATVSDTHAGGPSTWNEKISGYGAQSALIFGNSLFLGVGYKLYSQKVDTMESKEEIKSGGLGLRLFDILYLGLFAESVNPKKGSYSKLIWLNKGVGGALVLSMDRSKVLKLEASYQMSDKGQKDAVDGEGANVHPETTILSFGGEVSFPFENIVLQGGGGYSQLTEKNMSGGGDDFQSTETKVRVGVELSQRRVFAGLMSSSKKGKFINREYTQSVVMLEVGLRTN